MPPPGPAAGPPPMPGPGGPPPGPGPGPGAPPGAGPPPSPDDVMDARQQGIEQKVQAAAESVPTPTSPYKVTTINMLVKALNKLSDKVTGQDVPDIEFEAPKGESNWAAPLPLNVYVPMAVVAIVAGDIEGGERHAFDPTQVVDDASLKEAAGHIGGMLKDKKFMKSATQGAGAEGGPPSEAPPEPAGPEQYDEADQELMATM